MNLLFKVNRPIEVVYEYLTNMQKFVSVHPLISKISDLDNNYYLIHETLKFLFIPFSFTYLVTIESDVNDKKVTMKATVFKITKIEMIFMLSTENNYTIIKETITIKSPLPLKAIMEKIFKKQHSLLFQNISNIL